MVALRVLLAAALLLTASCTSIFDSYYPDSVEYIENQADIAQAVDHKAIVAVHMQLLQASFVHSYDILVVIVDTADGKQTVLFYDDSMKLVRSYSQSDLTAVVGSVPDLYPIMQDGTGGIYTGSVAYSFATRKSKPVIGVVSLAAQTFLTSASSSGNSQFQSAFYEDVGNVSYPSLFPKGSPQVSEPSSPSPGGGYYSVTALVAPGTISLPGVLNTSGAYDLAATCWNKTYYLLTSLNGSLYMVVSTALDASNMTGLTPAVAQPKNSQNGGLNLNQGWATATAGVVSSNSDNASLLQAFSWSGKDLGSLRVPTSSNSNSDDLAIAFHPNGKFWYFFDPANGKVTQYRSWW